MNLNRAAIRPLQTGRSPGPPGPSYALELIPATGQSPAIRTIPRVSMLESSGPNIGDLPNPLHRLFGYAGRCRNREAVDRRHLQAGDLPGLRLLHPARDLRPGHLRVRESLRCSHRRLLTVHQVPPGRPRVARRSRAPTTSSATRSSSSAGTTSTGPCTPTTISGSAASPTFGRNGADLIEVSSPPVGWAHGDLLGEPATFRRPRDHHAPVLTPPTTNGSLKPIAGPSYTYTGQTKIVLSGTT